MSYNPELTDAYLLAMFPTKGLSHIFCKYMWRTDLNDCDLAMVVKLLEDAKVIRVIRRKDRVLYAVLPKHKLSHDLIAKLLKEVPVP